MQPRSTLFGDRPRIVLHPMFLAAAYVLSLALPNEIRAEEMVRPLAVAIAAALALVLLGWVVFRNRWDGALAATILILLAVSLVPLLRAWSFLSGTLGATAGMAVLGTVLVAILGGVAIMVRRAQRLGRPAPRPAPGLLNIFSTALIGVMLIPGVAAVPAAMTRSDQPIIPEEAADPQTALPDIVMIMLDGYPRADVLERRFGIENDPFLDALRERGLDVGEASLSNYFFTSTTLASMFQMRYLDEVDALHPLIGTDGAHRGALRDAAIRSPAIALLRAAGYEILTAPSGWLHTSLAPAADRVLEHGELTDLERTLMERTWLLDLVDLVWPYAATESQRSRIVHAFDDLEAFGQGQPDGPRFFFAHIPAPHLPVVLDERGSTRHLPSRAFEATSPDAMGLTRSEYVAAWAEQLTYVNQRVLDVVDGLKAAAEPPVIVVFSDHGYGYEARDDDLQSRFGNLMAAYTPGADGLLADAPTPVNLLPLLFNAYVGTDLPLSPDRYFTGPADDRPLLITEVDDPERVPADS